MKKQFSFFSAAVLLVLAAGCAFHCPFCSPAEPAENFTVHNIYGSDMVLQRQKPIRISGKAPAGKSVTVNFAGKTVTAVADDQAHWEAVFPAMEAGGPYTLTVSAGKNAKEETFQNVMIGEVWLCSGQSNMSMSVSRALPFWRAMNAEEKVKNASHPNLRLFLVKLTVSPKAPREEIVGKWKVCSHKTIAQFSALGYFFGRELQKDLGGKIPVGIIASSWGGTPIQSWISEKGYEKANRLSELYKISKARNQAPSQNPSLNARIAKKLQQTKAEYKVWADKFYASAPEITKAALQNWSKPEWDETGWKPFKVPGKVDDKIDGIFWFRKTVDLPASWAGKDLMLQLGAIDDCDETFFNGVKVGETKEETQECWSTCRKYRIPGKLVKAGKNVIAVRLIELFGDGGFIGSAKELRLSLQSDPNQTIALAGEWLGKLEFQADIAKIGQRPTPPGAMPELLMEDDKSPHFPATLYNGMIHPWRHYPLRGIVWYQGESNAGNPQDYMTLHPLLIKDWRRVWNDPKQPFIFVQLAAFEKHQPKTPKPADFWKNRQPSNEKWPQLREVQTATLNIPYTGMIVAIDVGNPFDVHPRNKQILGYRGAKEAMRIAYGSKEISAGPLYRSMKIEGDKIRVSFDNVGGGLIAKDGKPDTFAIAGADGKFVWANAEIDGDTIVVSSPLVKEPKAVRYAWSSYPGNPNMFNKELFPMSPFRTDTPAYLLK